MNTSAIYSKSGKGVQEASGKTSHLPRSDRAVLAAIDGRATLADVAQKVGKPFDAAFEKLIESLDKGGFIREVSAGSASVAPKIGGAKPAVKAASSPMDASADLDFTTALSQPKAKAPPPPPPPPPSPEEKAKAERIAREQQEAVFRAREEAERKAAAERERVKAEAEAKMRAEQESKLRAEADAKLKAEAEAKVKAAADAKVKAAQEAAAKAAAEAKAKAEAEAKKVREEAERARKEAEEKAERARKEAERARKEAEEKAERARKEAERARKEAEEKAERARKEAEEKAERARKEAEEKAERARKEAEEKARREQEELMRKLEEERKARAEAERKAEEEARRVEEERRKLEEERVSRRIQEERERVERRKYQQEEEERAAKHRPKEEEEQPFPELKLNEPAAPPPPPPEPAKTGGGVGFSDTLLADLESFTTREEQAQKESEEAARKEKEAAAARAREAEARRQQEEAERRAREEREQRKREEAERKAKQEAELREREERERQRLREEEARRAREAEERARKAKQEEQLVARAERGPVFVEEAKARSRRERELAAKPRGAGQAGGRRRLGKSVALTLFGLLVVAVGVVHVMPIDTAEYERAATDALGRPVRIGSGRLSFVTGLQLKLSDVRIGEGVHIAEVRAYPEISALFGPRKTFERIEIDGARMDQASLGQVLFAGIKADNFNASRVTARGLELSGPLTLPKGLEFEAAYDRDGALRTANVRGADALLIKFSRRSQGQGFDVEMSAATFTLPFAPEITLGKFSAKGVATAQGMTLSEWDGAILSGVVSGTANVRWGDNWAVDGVVTARNLYAAVFAPALVSDGKAEGSGKFQMRGAPGKLASTARLDGSFTVTRGVLGSIDLTRAIQTGGKFATGRTEFSEMNGQATYDRGAVALRNITLGAGQLNAGASADIAQNGALSGRIVADVRVASQTLRATLSLAGTVKEPQVRN
jgi:hypothetical protein